jgi:Arc/MetJ family transcription regulator
MLYLIDKKEQIDHTISMETTVTIDTDLLNKTMLATGEQTQRQLVENALRFYELQNKQGKVRKYRGSLQWEGNLDELRTAKWL